MNYWIFSFLWVLAIMPKIVQLPILFIICLYMIYKRRGLKILVKDISSVFLTTNIIYFVAIFVSLFRFDHEASRILAAINTCFSVFIGIYFYGYYSNSKIDIRMVSKYMYHNSVILFLLYILYLVIGEKGNFAFMNGVLCNIDYVSGDVDYRFKGYLEYSNLVPYMYLFCYPISLIYVTERYRRKIIIIAYECIMLLPVIASNSRSGLLICSIVCISSIIITEGKTISSFLSNHKILMLFFAFAIAGIGWLFFHNQILSAIQNVFAVRQNSTNTRFQLYILSFEKMLH